MNQVSGVGALEDDDFVAIVVPQSVKVSRGALLFSGILTLVLGLQTVLSVRLTSFTGVIVGAMFGLGGSCSAMGFQLTRGSGRAAVMGIGFSAATFLLHAVWFVFGAFHGFVSLLAFILMPLASTSLICAARSVVWARRADGARERLRAQGLDSGQ